MERGGAGRRGSSGGGGFRRNVRQKEFLENEKENKNAVGGKEKKKNDINSI